MLRSFRRKARKALFFAGWTRHRRALEVDLPTHLQLEVTTRCNAACVWCSRNVLAKDQLHNDLTPAVLEATLASFPDLRSVRLLGLGEIFMHPDIERLLGMLTERRIGIWTFTNGAFLPDARVRELIHRHVGDLTISIDSADPAEFARLRPMGAKGLPEVLAGARQLIAERDAGRSDALIGVNATVSHTNIGALAGVADLCLELGVDYLSIAAVENWLIEGDPDYEPAHRFVSEMVGRQDVVRREVAAVRRRLLRHGILTGFKKPTPRLGRCHWPFNSAHIATDGTVTPCCIRSQPQSHGLFNLVTDGPFAVHWNGAAYRALRRAHLEGDTSNPMCGNCPR